MTQDAKWLSPENMKLHVREKSQHHIVWLHLSELFGISRCIEAESRLVVA